MFRWAFHLVALRAFALFCVAVFSSSALAASKYSMSLTCPADPDSPPGTYSQTQTTTGTTFENAVCSQRDDELIQFSKPSSANFQGGAGYSEAMSTNNFVLGLEVPGLGTFMEPTLNTDSQIVYGVPMGACPGESLEEGGDPVPRQAYNGRFIYAQWKTNNNAASSSQVGFGFFSVTPPDTGQTGYVMSATNRRNLTNLSDFGLPSFSAEGNCEDGVISFNKQENGEFIPGKGDQAGDLYLNALPEGGFSGIYATSSDRMIFTVPGTTAPSFSSLPLSWSGLVYDSANNTNVIRAVNLNLDPTEKQLSGYSLTGSTRNVADNTYPLNLNFNQGDPEVPGFYTGRIWLGSSASVPSNAGNVACAPVSTTYDSLPKVILACVAQAPDFRDKPFNLVLIGRKSTVSLATNFTSYGIGAVRAGGTAGTVTITVTNSGLRVAPSFTVDVAGYRFSRTGGTCPVSGTLGANTSCTIIVSYSPLSTDGPSEVTGTVNIRYTPTGGSEQLTSRDVTAITYIPLYYTEVACIAPAIGVASEASPHTLNTTLAAGANLPIDQNWFPVAVVNPLF